MGPPASSLLGPTPQGVSWLIWINTKTAIERGGPTKKGTNVLSIMYGVEATELITCARGGGSYRAKIQN